MSKVVTVVDHHKIADYIIETVQEDSILSGFQLEVYHDELESVFGNLTSDDLCFIYDLLGEREEVLDVILTEECFDVVIGTAYAPNYQEDE